MLNHAGISVREISKPSSQTRLHEFITTFLSEGDRHEGKGERWNTGQGLGC